MESGRRNRGARASEAPGGRAGYVHIRRLYRATLMLLYAVISAAVLAVALLAVGIVMHVRTAKQKPVSDDEKRERVSVAPIQFEVAHLPVKDISTRINAAAKLRDAGLISVAEFETLKIKILFE